LWGDIKMLKLNTVGWIAMALLIIGGLNWALVGLFEFDLVAAIFGSMSILSRVVYIVVGISAVYMIVEAALVGKFRYHESHKPHVA
jgi:hypothetical protein